MDTKNKPSGLMIAGGIISAGAIIAMFVSGFFCMTTASTYQSTMNELSDNIVTQQKNLDTISNASVLTVDEAVQNSNDATSLGQKVAELQNKYIGMSDDDAITANALSLSEAFSIDDQNARTPWFSYSIKNDAGQQAQWFFKSVTGYSDEDATLLDVAWLCTYGGSSEALAYATATYDPNENVFYNVTTHTTTFGWSVISSETEQEQADAAGTQTDVYNSSINDIVDALGDASSTETSDSGPVYPTVEATE